MDLKDWNLTISTFSDFSDALPLLLLMIMASGRTLQLLKIYFAGSLSVKVWTIILVFGFDSPNTLPYYHFLALFEFVLLFLYYVYATRLQWREVSIALGLVVVFNIVNTTYFQHLQQFNSYSWGVNTFVLMFMSFLYLYRLYANIEDVAIETHTGFIINAGFLLYFAGSLFTYILGWYILSSKPEGFFANGWIIQATSNILKNILIAYGLYRAYRYG